MPFRWSDSRRPLLQYEGHAQNAPGKKCDACGFLTVEFVPIYPPGPPVVPGTGSEIPPFVCKDFQTCCMRYRHGLSPVVFAAQLNWRMHV
jgi:hypothetical protein